MWYMALKGKPLATFMLMFLEFECTSSQSQCEGQVDLKTFTEDK